MGFGVLAECKVGVDCAPVLMRVRPSPSDFISLGLGPSSTVAALDEAALSPAVQQQAQEIGSSIGLEDLDVGGRQVSAMAYYGAANIEEFNLALSFLLLGMIIIGGMGTVIGSFFGAGFITLLPIFINQTMLVFLERVPSDLRANSEAIVFGGLIVFFLIVEPYGMARLWQTIKNKMRLWPFPY